MKYLYDSLVSNSLVQIRHYVDMNLNQNDGSCPLGIDMYAMGAANAAHSLFRSLVYELADAGRVSLEQMSADIEAVSKAREPAEYFCPWMPNSAADLADHNCGGVYETA